MVYSLCGVYVTFITLQVDDWDRRCHRPGLQPWAIAPEVPALAG